MTTPKVADPAEQTEADGQTEAPGQAEAAEPKVSDLTVSQLRELIREVVLDCISESYEDFHLDLRINPQFAAELQASIDEVAAGGETYSAEEVAKELGLS